MPGVKRSAVERALAEAGKLAKIFKRLIWLWSKLEEQERASVLAVTRRYRNSFEDNLPASATSALDLNPKELLEADDASTAAYVAETAE